MCVSVFQHPAFVWVCVTLAGGSLAAAVAVGARTFWAELAARFMRLPAAGKAAFVTFVAVATAVAQKPGNVSKDSHGLGGTVLSTDHTDLHGLSGNGPAALNAEETEEERHGEELKKGLDKIDWSVEAVASNPQNPVKETPRLSASSISVLSESNSPSVTDEDIARGYRLVEVRTNETISYELPTNGTVVGTWHLTDAYEAVVRVGLGEGEGRRKKEEGRSAELSSSFLPAQPDKDASATTHLPSSLFLFPLGHHVATSLWAHVWGKARSQLKNASNELVAVGAPMFAHHGVSRLWTAATTNGTVLLTWESFFLGNNRIFEYSNNRIEGSSPANDRLDDSSSTNSTIRLCGNRLGDSACEALWRIHGRVAIRMDRRICSLADSFWMGRERPDAGRCAGSRNPRKRDKLDDNSSFGAKRRAKIPTSGGARH